MLVEQVTDFIYWGPNITEDAECKVEIRSRISPGDQHSTTESMALWKSHDLLIATKIGQWETLVWLRDVNTKEKR